MSQYFRGDGKFALLAHRGLAVPGSGTYENTSEAFSAALDAGATHIETDVQVTKDGIAVLFHDENLLRLTGDSRKVDQVSLAELLEICGAAGFEPLSLPAALSRFPEAKFNLDIKSWGAVRPAVAAIETIAAHARVLVSSFSDTRRLAALRLLDTRVATSAGASTVIKTRLASAVGARRMLQVSLLGVDALQIPTAMYGVRFAKKRFIADLRNMGVEVHFWTVNSPERAVELLALGATGLVSDRVDLLAPLLGKG